MDIIFGAVIIWFLSQTTKFIIRLLKGERITSKAMLWSYIWAAGYPSTHSSILAGSAYFIGVRDEFGVVFSAFTIVAILLIYNLIDNRKQQEILRPFHESGGLYDRVLDMSGHKPSEVLAGVFLGTIMAYVLAPMLLF
jgi:acid phosphatase family membrane protein YuiD